MLVPCLSILDTLPLDSPSTLGAHSSGNHTLGRASFTGLPPRHLPGDPVSEGPMLGLMSYSGHLEIINNLILGLVSCKWSRWDTRMCVSRDAPGSSMCACAHLLRWACTSGSRHQAHPAAGLAAQSMQVPETVYSTAEPWQDSSGTRVQIGGGDSGGSSRSSSSGNSGCSLRRAWRQNLEA